ncbi:DNA translocase FtsK [Neobacillus massiliamazoniensis]|uniref:Cell division FtsK/SpoIIIE n=1 Tax=Neobacillus massiliamazoniensis TaxID=1499688 RepID=A0A0U1P2U2_9BACI|nr:DNA translocase FtsK [Neobacillus massiliamazoniensis]CRK84442.1 cell division FtsK/SpoIIIE [Neobacillus massiliamazoniensis]
MNWVQNLLQRLKKDEEKKAVEYELHNDIPKQPPQRDAESGKELETRISFQYPKTGIISTNNSDKTKLQEEQPKKQPKSYNKIEHRRQRENLDLAEVQPTEKAVAKPKSESVVRQNRPFHPTEIPSPVYGFNRPKRSNPLVEHELSHFSNKIDSHKISPIVDTNSDVEWMSSSAPTYSKSVQPEDQNNESIENNVKIESIDLEEPIGLDCERAPGDSNSTEDPSEVVSTMVSEGLEESYTPGDSNSTEDPPEVVSTMVSEGLEESYTPADSNSTEDPPEVVSTMVTEVLEESYTPGDSNSTEDPRKVVSTMAAEVLEESNAPIEAEPVKNESRRSRLPFNVVMLKQDKLNWQERKRGRFEEQKKSTQPDIHRVEQSSEIKQKNDQKEEIQILTEASLYKFPALSLLNPPVTASNDSEWLQLQEKLLNQALQDFNVGARVVNVTQGPSVTRFEVQPEPGVKVNKITNLSDDIKLSLAAKDIRIEAPIPGKHTIGIEVPNQKSRPVQINEIINSQVFQESASPLTAVLGLDISGMPIVTDLKKMPHGLIAGATGSGKSVCINSILVSLLYKATPDELKLLLIDPKMVELAPYNHIPHLVSPVITDVKAATAALKWAVDEMERRYELFAHTGVRDISRFNELAIQHKRYADKLPFIVIIIDELADLMMMSPADVEEAICRIAQKARACGIHLIIATQRPSVDVITGLIKANIPTRIAFSVSSQIDSRTIIDIGGAEKLLGRGDMLFLENGSSKPVRLQGTFVSDEEIDLVVAHVRDEREPEYLFQQDELLKKAQVSEEEDELFFEVCEYIIDQGGASTSSLQRRFKIGYNRAARLMDMLENQGFITGANGSKPREVLITESDLESIQESAQ